MTNDDTNGREGDDERRKRMAELGRLSGAARRRKKSGESLRDQATAALVRALESGNAAAATAAAKAILGTKSPVDEEERRLDIGSDAPRGVLLSEILSQNCDYRAEAITALAAAIAEGFDLGAIVDEATQRASRRTDPPVDDPAPSHSGIPLGQMLSDPDVTAGPDPEQPNPPREEWNELGSVSNPTGWQAEAALRQNRKGERMPNGNQRPWETWEDGFDPWR